MFGFDSAKHKAENLDSEGISTYLNLTVSTDPFLELPAENEFEFYSGAEEQNLLLSATSWAKGISSRFKDRLVKAFGENIKGQSVFLCRYIQP